MACTLSSGRTEPCKDVVGGLRNVYIINFEANHYQPTDDSGDSSLEIKGLSRVGKSANNVQAYKFELKGNSSYTENLQASRENGTLAFEQVLELQLKKLTKESHKEIKALSFGRPHIIVEDYNKNLFLIGREHGMEVTGGTIATGTAMADMSGYTLTFTGMERKPSQFINKTSATETIAATLSGAKVDVDDSDSDTDLNP